MVPWLYFFLGLWRGRISLQGVYDAVKMLTSWWPGRENEIGKSGVLISSSKANLLSQIS
jgi:hypothetical protein